MLALTQEHGLYEMYLTEISLGTEKESTPCSEMCCLAWTKRRMFNT